MVIHFVDLDELLAELEEGHVVRVVAMEMQLSAASQHGIYLSGIGVHVRAICWSDDMAPYIGHTLSCYIPTKHFQMVAGKPMGQALLGRTDARRALVRRGVLGPRHLGPARLGRTVRHAPQRGAELPRRAPNPLGDCPMSKELPPARRPYTTDMIK